MWSTRCEIERGFGVSTHRALPTFVFSRVMQVADKKCLLALHDPEYSKFAWHKVWAKTNRKTAINAIRMKSKIKTRIYICNGNEFFHSSTCASWRNPLDALSSRLYKSMATSHVPTDYRDFFHEKNPPNPRNEVHSRVFCTIFETQALSRLIARQRFNLPRLTYFYAIARTLQRKTNRERLWMWHYHSGSRW